MSTDFEHPGLLAGAPHPLQGGGVVASALDSCRLAGCLALVLVMAFVLLAAGCDDEARPMMANFAVTKNSPLSLRETFDYLRSAYERKAYLAMVPYIEPDNRRQVVGLLVAADELLAANAGARKAIDRHCPQIMRDRYELAPLVTHNLEMFSAKIKVVGQREEESKGVISIEIEGVPTAVEVDFRLFNGRWVYVPGPGLDQIVAGYRDVAKALNGVAQSLNFSDDMTPEQVEREYQLRVIPKLKQMSRVMASS